MAGLRAVFIGLSLVSSAAPFEAAAGPVAGCEDLTFADELRDGISPVSQLEAGAYIFEASEPVARGCLLKRVCEVDEFTRAHDGQSYYLSLSTRGGQEIEAQFPDIVASVLEARGADRNIYLANFCQAVADASARGQ